MRILHCLNALDRAIEAEGDIIELGVASGATTFPMADYVKWHNAYVNKSQTKRRVFACDTFAGLPYDDSDDNINKHKMGEFNFGENFKIIKSQRTDLPIITIEGLVEETLETNFYNRKFCFAFLDMDLYNPTSYAVKFLSPRISVGGIIGFHDYQWYRTAGIDKVVDEELDKTKFVKVFQKDFCIFFRKMTD